MLSAFLRLWLVVQSWSLCLRVQHEQSFQSIYNVLSQKSNDNNPSLRNVDMLTHWITYHLKALFALVTIVWDPGWYDLHRVEYSTECIQFGRCFLGAFSFYAAEVGRTKLKHMSLSSAPRELSIDISFFRLRVEPILRVNETWTSWIIKFCWNQTQMDMDNIWKLSSH